MPKITFVTGILLLSFAALGFAADTPPLNQQETYNESTLSPEAKATSQTPIQKLNRGIINIVTAPIEIAKQVDLGWKESAKNKKSASGGIMFGFVKGVTYTVGRMGSGLWDVVSFPFKTPDNYQPLMKPNFVLDK